MHFIESFYLLSRKLSTLFNLFIERYKQNPNKQQQLMILQHQHKHQQSISSPPIINPVLIHQPPSMIIYQLPKPPSILTHLLSNSAQLLNQKSVIQIKEMLKYSEQKIHLAFSDEPNSYLAHMISKTQNNDNQSLLNEIISLENDIFVDKIQNGNQKVYEKANFKDLKDSLTNKITDMKKNIMSMSSIDKKAGKQFQNLMEFRRKSYWNIPSQKNYQLKQFLTKMKRIYSEHKKSYKRSYVEMEKRSKKQIQEQLKIKEVRKKEQYSKQLQKQTVWRKDRQRYNQQQKKKRQQIQNLLKKYNPEQRIYQRKQQQFIKNVIQPMQEERQKRLQQIKEGHQPLDHQEFEDHLQRYQEYKQSLMQGYSKKKQQEKQIDDKMQQELKQLFHGKFHQDLQPRFYNSAKIERESIRKKVKQYGTQIRDKYKPQIDQRKRSQLKESIRDLQLLKDKKKRKTMLEDGTFIIEDKPDIDGKKLGVKYLQNLREINQGKPRKRQDRSESMMELQNRSKIKKIDYLRQNKPDVKLKHSMGDWKKVLHDSSFSPRQKYASIMQKVNMMDQKAKQKQSEVRLYKKGQKTLQLKQQMDKFYMESVAAKMVILKDVILRQ